MERVSQRTMLELTQYPLPHRVNNESGVDLDDMPETCALCRIVLPAEGEMTADTLNANICSDCKFLLLEDFGTPSRNSHRRRSLRRRRATYSSRLVQRTSSSSVATTPDGSRRWQRLFSDTESDGFDLSDSLYGDSESNTSFGAYRIFHGDSDATSLSPYRGDSDMSADGSSFLDTDLFVQSMNQSDSDSDNDIDPMHAGLINWNSDDHEESDEEADSERDLVEPPEARAQLETILIESSDGSVGNRRISRNNQMNRFFTNTGELHGVTYHGMYRNYLEELLAHLSENERSGRGAPPAAVSFVNSLPRIIINDDQVKPDSLACAICKDLLSVGSEANQLPCLHLYHPSCILPWLSMRNSCPLCRFELPTDDMDSENRKRNVGSHLMDIHEIQQQSSSDDSSSEFTESTEMCEDSELREALGEASNEMNRLHRSGGGRWLLPVAAPIVGFMGMILVLWFSGPNLLGHGGQQLNNSRNQIRHRQSRRWWWWF